MNTRARMTTRTTGERRNGEESLERGAKMSQSFRTLASTKRAGTRIRRNMRASPTENGKQNNSVYNKMSFVPAWDTYSRVPTK